MVRVFRFQNGQWVHRNNVNGKVVKVEKTKVDFADKFGKQPEEGHFLLVETDWQYDKEFNVLTAPTAGQMHAKRDGIDYDDLICEIAPQYMAASADIWFYFSNTGTLDRIYERSESPQPSIHAWRTNDPQKIHEAALYNERFAAVWAALDRNEDGAVYGDQVVVYTGRGSCRVLLRGAGNSTGAWDDVSVEVLDEGEMNLEDPNGEGKDYGTSTRQQVLLAQLTRRINDLAPKIKQLQADGEVLKKLLIKSSRPRQALPTQKVVTAASAAHQSSDEAQLAATAEKVKLTLGDVLMQLIIGAAPGPITGTDVTQLVGIIDEIASMVNHQAPSAGPGFTQIAGAGFECADACWQSIGSVAQFIMDMISLSKEAEESESLNKEQIRAKQGQHVELRWAWTVGSDLYSMGSAGANLAGTAVNIQDALGKISDAAAMQVLNGAGIYSAAVGSILGLVQSVRYGRQAHKSHKRYDRLKAIKRLAMKNPGKADLLDPETQALLGFAVRKVMRKWRTKSYMTFCSATSAAGSTALMITMALFCAANI
jgi:hypothetical protein